MGQSDTLLEPTDGVRHSSWRVYGATTAVTVLIGLATSAIYDLIGRPGVTWLLRVLTLGSHALRDSIYASAALDPTNLPITFVATFAPSVLVGAAIAFPIARLLMRKKNAEVDALRERADELHDAPSSEVMERAENLHAEIDKMNEWVSRAKRKMDRALIILLLVAGLSSYIASSMWSQAVMVWRVFHANITICESAISDGEAKILRARFAAMRTRDEYVSIDADMQKIASQHGLKLVSARVF